MGQHQQEIVAGSAALRRMILVLTVAALMVAMMVASAMPAFAAPKTIYNCFSTVSGVPIPEYQGLSNGQAKKVLNTFPDVDCDVVVK
jgi:hypothetical protein